MTLPPLPEPAAELHADGQSLSMFAEAQMRAFQAATVEACAAEIEKLKAKVAERSAEHLEAHINYDKGYTEGRLDAVEACAKSVEALERNGAWVTREEVLNAIRSLQ